jgi:hypothetical protein
MSIFIKKFNRFIKKRRPYKGERKDKQDQRGCATITAKMVASLPNVHMRGRKKLKHPVSLIHMIMLITYLRDPKC